MDISSLYYWDHGYNSILVLNLAICIAIFTSIRWFSGTISHINASRELIRKDNPAFGISMAGMLLGVAIVLSSVIYGEAMVDMIDSAIAVGLYGIIGIIFMATTRIVFDKFTLPNISIRDEIVKGNVAAGIIDAGNVVATAMIIRAVTMWVDSRTVEGIQSLIIAYIISQLLLSANTYLRIKFFAAKNDGKSMQQEFEKGNIALALRFSGHRIGTAFAITASSYLIVYQFTNVYELLLVWTLLTVLMMLVLGVLAFLAQSIILSGIDVNDEVVRQRNVALGAVQGIIFLSMGLLLSELMA